MALATMPQTPADISLFIEDGKYIFRVGESQSIYVYDRDKAGVATCVDECSRLWPAVIASPNSSTVGDWTLLARADGSQQWCYRNRPIYTYAHDTPGKTSGDGIEGLWHVVIP
jgi:predicted lipoprotein with Yx(FWY)xxD motif